MAYNTWTENEVTLLRNMATQKKTVHFMSAKLGRTPRAIYDKAFKIGLSFRHAKRVRWYRSEVALLRSYAEAKWLVPAIAKKLGRTERAVYQKAAKEGIRFRAGYFWQSQKVVDEVQSEREREQGREVEKEIKERMEGLPPER